MPGPRVAPVALELGQDARRRRGQTMALALARHLAGGVTLGQLEVDMAVAQPRVDQLDQGPDAGGKACVTSCETPASNCEGGCRQAGPDGVA